MEEFLEQDAAGPVYRRRLDVWWVREASPGRLGLMSRPPGGAGLPGAIEDLSRQAVTTLVSMLERSEGIELELGEEEALCAFHHIHFLPFPVMDRGVPADAKAFASLAKDLAARVQRSESVVVHCRAGIGRAGMTVSAVLATLGLPVREAISATSRARRVPVPDTPEQEDWLRALAAKGAFRIG